MENTFQSYALKPIINKIVAELGFTQPTPIQQKVIPPAIKGESLIGQSHTGSGKTHAYLLPIFNQLVEDKREVQYIITAPTRELAIQIFDEVKKVIKFANKEDVWHSKLFIGGTDKQRQIDKLKEQPQIIVGTPGRILDLVNAEALDVHKVKGVVLDEADLLVDLGFLNEVDQLLVRMTKEVQILVFSATIPKKLQPFLKKYFESPTYIKIDDDKPSPETMEHRLIPLRHRGKAEVIYNITKLINPYLALVFVNRKEHADQLAKELTEKGLEVGLLHGGLKPRERKRMLTELKNLRYQYIVATDLAARGIDIKGVSHVINAELPREEEFYIHRVGRTARAGLEGTAINLYTDSDENLIRRLEKSGLTFESYDIRKGEWEEIKNWNERQTRERPKDEAEKQAWSMVKRPKSVKPGYKKKMKREAERNKKKINRSQIRRKK